MGSVKSSRAPKGGKFNGQLLAIKRLHPNIAQDPQFVGMFLDEAWMTAALASPNVVGVAAWGNDDKGMFLAVEFVQGVSLARLIKESQINKEPFAERTVAFLGSQICAGLVAAHGVRGPDNTLLGLVHRDLTPGNLLVSFEGVLKIADFGIAKAEERITHTRTGTLKGKPSYMAPEQARGGKVDLRADLFSLGVLLFELLAGRRPVDVEERVRRHDGDLDVAAARPPRAPQGREPGVRRHRREVPAEEARRALRERRRDPAEARRLAPREELRPRRPGEPRAVHRPELRRADQVVPRRRDARRAHEEEGRRELQGARRAHRRRARGRRRRAEGAAGGAACGRHAGRGSERPRRRVERQIGCTASSARARSSCRRRAA